jgi:hypothetical protein
MRNQALLLQVNQDNRDTITLSQEAFQDKQLGPDLLSLLLFLCNHKPKDNDKFRIGEALERFGRKDRTWWTRKFNKLKELGYGKYFRQVTAKTITHIYVVTDSPELIKDLDEAPVHHHDDAKMQHGTTFLETVFPKSPEVKDHTHEVANLQHKRLRKKEKDKTTPTARAREEKAKTTLRFMDPLTTPQEHRELSEYYILHGMAAPREYDDFIQAGQPGMRAWAEITKSAIGWTNAPLINQNLKGPINKPALLKAWQMWNGRGFNPRNVIGILEWYQDINRDEKAEPWNKIRRNNDSTNTGRQSQNQDPGHGLPTIQANEVEYVTLDVTDEELGFIPSATHHSTR